MCFMDVIGWGRKRRKSNQSQVCSDLKNDHNDFQISRNLQSMENHIPRVSFLLLEMAPFYVIVGVGIFATVGYLTFWSDDSLLLCLSQAYLAPSWYLNGPANEVVKADILNTQTALPAKALLHRNVRIQSNFKLIYKK